MNSTDPLALTAASSSRTLVRRIPFAPVLALAGLALLVAAQSQMQHQQLPLWSIAALLGGLGLWVVALWTAKPRRALVGPLVVQEPVVRWGPLGIACICAVYTWINTSAGVYTTTNLVSWIASVGIWCWAWWPRSALVPRQGMLARPMTLLLWLALMAIIALGAFFRFYRLADIPADPTSDHAEKLFDILDLINGQRPIFFPRNTGREPGQFYITFGLMQLLGLPLRFETLKFGTALVGLLTIPAVFLLARELAGRISALFAAALFAIAKWPVATARMGLRYPYAQLPTALVLWLLLRYVRRGDRRDALLCGLVIGLGLQGYISFRIVPLLVPLIFGLALITDRRWRERWRQLVGDLALIAVTALLTCLPLAHYTVQHPDQVWYRVATRAASTERPAGAWSEQALTFAINNWHALRAFNWRGDVTVVNAVQHDPFLDVVTGAALLAGLLIIGYQIIVQRDMRYAAVLLATPVLALPSTLSLAFPIENPSANRIGTLAPVIFTVAALALAYIAQDAWRSASIERFRSWRLATYLLLGGALLLATQQNYIRYFYDFDRQYQAHVMNTQEIGRTLQDWQELGVSVDHMYLLAYPHWLDGRNIALALDAPSWKQMHDLLPEAPLPDQVDGQPLLFVLHPDDDVRQAALKQRFPQGTFILISGTMPSRDFGLYFVPPP